MTRLGSLLPLSLAVFATLPSREPSRPRADRFVAGVSRVIPTDNRRPAGILHAGVLTIRLEARLGAWHPDGDNATVLRVRAGAGWH